MKNCFTALLLVFALTLTQAQVVSRLPLSTRITGFVENIGQVRDQHGKPNDHVRYMFTDGTFHLALNQNGFSYEFLKIEQDQSEAASPFSDEEGQDNSRVYAHRVDVTLKGMNALARIEGTGVSDAFINCYQNVLPQKGFYGARLFNEVTYREVYPHIDMVFSNDEQKGLKYEFVLYPGADPDDIKMAFSGATSMFLNENKELEVFTSLGKAKETAPVTYRVSDLSIIPSSFILKGNTIGFRLNRKDIKNTTVVIDPTLIWGTFYGGPSGEMVAEVDVDNKSKVILSGHTISTTFIATAGAHQTTYAGGGNDLFCAKFKANGKIEWATYFGAAGKDICYGVAVDHSSNPNDIVLVGNTTSSTGIATPGAHQEVLGGDGDILIAKFSGAGLLLWSTYMGGLLPEHSRQAAIDEQGNIYFTGTTKSLTGIATPGSYEATYQGGNGDSYLAKFNAAGQRIWSTYLGGSGNDRNHGICLDHMGHVYLHGTTDSESGIASPGAHQTIHAGVDDAFVTKFDTSGAFDWSTYLGGERGDHGRGVVADGAGNIYVAGFSLSLTGISTPGAFQEEWSPPVQGQATEEFDGFLSKFTPSGELKWSTYYGSNDNDIFNTVVADGEAMIYASGSTRSYNGIATADGFQPVKGGGQDGFFIKFDSAGNRIWGSFVGGISDENINGSRLGADGFLYFAMNSDGGPSPITPGTYQTKGKGGGEAAVYKFNPGNNCADVYEPNETSATAKKLTAYSDSTLYGFSGGISSSMDADWYSVKLAAGENLKIKLTGLSKDYDLKLYKKNAFLFSSIHSGTTDEVIVYNNVPASTYKIEIVHAATEYDAVHCYQLKVMTKTSPWLNRNEDGQGGYGTDGSLLIYPNPASSVLNVKYIDGSAEAVIYIADLLGRQVYVSHPGCTEKTGTIQIPVSQLSNGVYLLSWHQDGRVQQQKVVIHHE